MPVHETLNLYHENSKNRAFLKQATGIHLMNYGERVHRISREAPKIYATKPRIELPEAARDLAGVSFERAAFERQSWRSFDPEKELRLREISTLLKFGVGVVSRPRETGWLRKKVAAQSGNLSSVETYLVAFNVKGLAPGVYHYNSLSHELEMLVEKNLRNWFADRAIFQRSLCNAAAMLVHTGNIHALCSKYGARGYRLALLDCGHVSQTIYLVAAALKLGCCAIAGFVDDAVQTLLAVDEADEVVLLMHALGRSA